MKADTNYVALTSQTDLYNNATVYSLKLYPTLTGQSE